MKNNDRTCGMLMLSCVILWVRLVYKETFFKEQNDIIALSDELRNRRKWRKSLEQKTLFG